MSPAKGNEDFIGIHFTWKHMFKEIVEILPILEDSLDKFNAKPHFGKLFEMSGNKFEKLFGDDLVELRTLISLKDPCGKFSNEFTEKYIFNKFNQKL